VQLGLSLTLLIGAGLLAKSFLQLRNLDPGFRPENVLSGRISLNGPAYANVPRQMDFFEKVLAETRPLPGVESAALADRIPFGGGGVNNGAFFVENRPPASRGQESRTFLISVTDDFFRVLSIPLHQGRLPSARDTAQTAPVIAVNASFARLFFPNEDPLGKRISLGIAGIGDPVWMEIVGVVADVRQFGMDRETEPIIYRSARQNPPFLGRMILMVRSSADPRALTPAIEKAIASLDPDQPIVDVKTIDERIDESLGSRRFNAVLVGGFAAIAIILAAVGVYGVMAHLVTLRTHEIGVRLALGARAAQILRMVIGQGLALGLLGVLLGLGGAFLLSRYLATLLVGVSTHDPATFAGFSLGLLAVALAACYVPGSRAAQVDPLIALRHD
jgi:putative ABC transport system permease protein